MPGNGFVALHFAHAQSLDGIDGPSVIFPSMVSARCVVSFAFVVSSVIGLYGTGFALMINGRESGPLALTMRPSTRPGTGEPSGFFAIGTVTQSLSSAGTVRPELSPCHPLLKPMSPSMRDAGGIVILPPRFGTSCHIRWLVLDISIGLTSRKLATYSTRPFALRGANLMSVMIALCGSLGSSSPKARPASVSYWPAGPKDCPLKAGETFLSMTIFLT